MKVPFFRISGIFVLVFSILSIILIKNLFAKFLAFSLVIIFVYLLIYHLFIHLLYKKRKIEFTSLTGRNLLLFKKSVIEITGTGFPSLFPGIFFSINFDINENNSILHSAVETVGDIDNGTLRFETLFDRHGKYELTGFKLIFQDIFGFTHYELGFEFEQEIAVLPYFTDDISIPYFTNEGGDQAIQNASKVSSTDFFENRKYYPGDDVRRINWKIFAHIDELHIREVEKIPPKVGEISLLFAPYSDNIIEYEYISSLFFSTCYFLLEKKFDLSILAPYSNSPILINSENEKEFNNIIFNSFKPFPFKKTDSLQSPVVFASFSEYSKMMGEGYLKKDSYCKISFSENDETRRSLISSVFRIDTYDNMFRELADKSSQLKKKKYDANKLQALINNGLSKGIDTEVFKVTYEQFKNFK